MRFFALIAAAALLTTSLCAIVVASVVYDGRATKAAARSPQTLEGNPTERPVALWGYTYDTVDDLQYSVIFIAPLVDDAPLPPGLTRWPGPEEVLLSPALAKAGEAEGISTRFGKVVGRIGPEGLESPGERIAYVRPPESHLSDSRLFEIVGYGSPGGGGIGEHTLVTPLWVLRTALVSLLVLPAVVLIAIAARLGAAGRDRRTALLQALGGSWTARAVINLGEAALPVALGAIVGLLPWGLAMLAGYRIPLTGFMMPSADLRGAWWRLCLAALLAVLCVLVAVVLLHNVGRARRRKSGGQSVVPRPRSEKLPTLKLALCPLFLLLATRGPDLFAAQSPFWFIIIYTLGVIGTLATLPSVLSVATAAVGRGLAGIGSKRGSSSALVAGRWMSEQPGVTARLVAGIVIGIGLMGQVQVHSSRISEPMIAAEATVKRVGGSVLTLKMPEQSARLSSFTNELPDGISTLALTQPDAQGNTTLQAPCETLTKLRLACDGSAKITRAQPDKRLSELANWGSPSGVIIVRDKEIEARTEPPSQQLVLISTTGADLPLNAVKSSAYRDLSLSPGVGTLGYSWYVGAKERAQTVNWAILLGLVGLVTLGVAAAVNNAGEFLRFSRAAAPLTVLTGQRRLYVAIAGWTIGLPLLLATFVGLFVNYWLVSPMTVPLIGARISDSGILAMGFAGAALAVGSWMAGSVQAVHQAGRWSPEAD
ncbi:hypothetical protein [Streptomyces hydrogenans]|uniref:ABC transporter permease n=1 Tax=Streptomyces hydrogenans TaxID=1873719 RepID=A0ABQ3PNK7_9ACTN|nr:hypothetical protein [Streptomyces hydrogenans]GHG41163.1 hypothetical protein GCM10018784_63630 [Streptomyces hydrogenans]GHI26606.1 hypothetical protein Shyd_79770 [Streptomyces hydrogenans]